MSEIFHSLQGEGTRAGLPCAFVRLAGCELACSYCDTAYARSGGEAMSVADVVDRLGAYRCPLVEVTGGEPLLQDECGPLLEALVAAGHTVLLETSGSRPLDGVPDEVHVIMDLKAPGSGMESRNLYANLESLDSADELKIVLTDRADYVWARDLLREGGWAEVFPVLLQPAAGLLDGATLAAWILEDGLPLRLGLQLHKILWPHHGRGV